MKQIDPKNRSMICRMAGNVAGPVYVNLVEAALQADPKDLEGKDLLEMTAILSYGIAASIVEQVDMRTPCGKCDECNEGIRCRELPKDEE